MKKTLAVILTICIIYLIGFTVYEKVSYSNLSFDEKVLEIMNFDEFTGTKYVDGIAFITEVEDGYFCIATASSDNTVHFGYIRDNNGNLEFAGKSFSSLPLIIYNQNPSEFLRTSILNFSEKDFYYCCYQHNENAEITIDGKKAEIYNFTLNYKEKEYTMDFWLVCSEKEPTVTIIQ